MLRSASSYTQVLHCGALGDVGRPLHDRAPGDALHHVAAPQGACSSFQTTRAVVGIHAAAAIIAFSGIVIVALAVANAVSCVAC